MIVSHYLSMNSIFPLCMQKIHEMASLIRLVNKFNPLNNQICTWTNPPNSQEYVIWKKIRSKSLHSHQFKKELCDVIWIVFPFIIESSSIILIAFENYSKAILRQNNLVASFGFINFESEITNPTQPFSRFGFINMNIHTHKKTENTWQQPFF